MFPQKKAHSLLTLIPWLSLLLTSCFSNLFRNSMCRNTYSSISICRDSRSPSFEQKDPELFLRRLRFPSGTQALRMKPFLERLLFWLLDLPIGGSLNWLDSEDLDSPRFIRWNAMPSRARYWEFVLSCWLLDMCFLRTESGRGDDSAGLNPLDCYLGLYALGGEGLLSLFLVCSWADSLEGSYLGCITQRRPSLLSFCCFPLNFCRKGVGGESGMECMTGQLIIAHLICINYCGQMQKGGAVLPLAAPLKFWYQHFVKGEGTFEESLKPVATVNTLEDFWGYYQHFKRPTQLPVGSYIYLFQDKVKPVWEDEHNQDGGAFVLRFERAKCNRLWEDILLGFVSAGKEVLAFLNGIRLKVRKDFTEVDFWVRDVQDEKAIEDCRSWIIGVTTLDNDTPLELIHFHQDE